MHRDGPGRGARAVRALRPLCSEVGDSEISVFVVVAQQKAGHGCRAYQAGCAARFTRLRPALLAA